MLWAATSVPLPWSDNYIELMPGESRILTASATPAETVAEGHLVSGWNIPSKRRWATPRERAGITRCSNTPTGN